MINCYTAAGDVYLRTGVGLDRSVETEFTDRNCSSTSPAALYGCGLGHDGEPRRSVGDFGTAGVFELGFGYTDTPVHRFELLVEYRPHLAFHGRANFRIPDLRHQQSVIADLSSLSAMVVAYVDLRGLSLHRFGALDPFIGFGVGTARIHIGETRMTFPKTTTVVPGASGTGFAWMLTAGVAMPLKEGKTLDFAWRYSDLGEVRTGQGEGRVIRRDGSQEPVQLNLAQTRARLRTHGIRLSVRYAF